VGSQSSRLCEELSDAAIQLNLEGRTGLPRR
jgi:hypothetical protein